MTVELPLRVGNCKRLAWLHSIQDWFTGHICDLFSVFTTTETHESPDHVNETCCGCDPTTSSDPILATSIHVLGPTLCRGGFSDRPMEPKAPKLTPVLTGRVASFPPGSQPPPFVRSKKRMTRPLVTGSDTCTSRT